MAHYDSSRRVGRSQAASIFWGLVSVCFAGAACYYFFKAHEQENSANQLRDQVLTLQEQRETLNSQKESLQSNLSSSEAQLKSREDFLNEKEQKLAQEESQLESQRLQGPGQSQQNQAQAAAVKKFNDTVRKLVKDDEIDVVVRGGRPVLRVPSSVFFGFGDTTLKPEGKAMLKTITSALDGLMTGFEFRVEVFTDGGGENNTSVSLAPPKDEDKSGDATKKPVAWTLTGARAGVLAQFLREQTPLPFSNVLVVPRADVQPIIPAGNESHARNRRLEITITPYPVPYHAADAAKEVKPAKGKAGDTDKPTKPKSTDIDKPAKDKKSDSDKPKTKSTDSDKSNSSKSKKDSHG